MGTKDLTKCILYEIELDYEVVSSSGLATAQAEAVTQNLPIAAIYFHPNPKIEMDNQKILEILRDIEEKLAEYNIPLMVFIGNRKDRLEGIDMYLNPIKIYDKNIETKGDEKLQLHPINWPGTVFSTQILESRILAGV